MKTVLVTGGAGYVGCVLTPKLLSKGWKVRVLDTLFYDEHALDPWRGNSNLEIVKADIRDKAAMERALKGIASVIHLASISNDPSSDLDPQLTREVNYDAVVQMAELCLKGGIQKLINASSSSVYGVKDLPRVTEEETLEPLTLYAKLKAATETVIQQVHSPKMAALSIRSATVCGYSPRLRLDLTVNILTAAAICKGVITVFGGSQKRPNIHIEDITDLYTQLLELPAEKIGGKIYNAGADNYTVMEIAETVRGVIGEHIRIAVSATNDLRSYHISSEKIKKELGFRPLRTVRDAVMDLKKAFDAGKVPNAMEDSRYINVKVLQEKYHADKKSAAAR